LAGDFRFAPTSFATTLFGSQTEDKTKSPLAGAFSFFLTFGTTNSTVQDHL
jgi:hypothetical protein